MINALNIIIAEVAVGTPIAAILLHRHRRTHRAARQRCMINHPSNQFRNRKGA